MMKDIKLSQATETDIAQINEWKNIYADKFTSIEQFVLEGGMIPNLDMLIAIHESDKTDSKLTHSLVAKTRDNEVVGLLLTKMYNIKSETPDLKINQIAINPKYQHSGYGYQILTELFENPKKYLSKTPYMVFCNIDNENLASMFLFLKLGFDLQTPNRTTLFSAESTLPKILDRINQNKKSLS